MQSKSGKADTSKNLATNGIEINRDISLDSEALLQFDAWDFGGQEVFYPTHRFFLTDKAIFLVLFRLENYQESRLEYWMKTIKAVTNNSKNSLIFLVGTHFDKVSSSDLELVRDTILRKFSKQFYRGLLPTVFCISAKTGHGVKELKAKIVESVKDSDFLPIVPKPWVEFYFQIVNYQASLHEIKQQSDHDDDATTLKQYIFWEEFEEWAGKAGIASSECKLLAEFLSSAGTISHINDPASNLDKIVVLDPQWLTDLMAALITFQHSFIKNGILQEQCVPQIFNHYPPSIHQTLIALLQRYAIAIRLKAKQCYIVPSLLPEMGHEDLNQSVWTFPEQFSEIWTVHGKDYQFSFLPLGFFAQVIGRILLIEDSELVIHTIWRNGIIIEREFQEIALITFDPVTFLLKTRVKFKKELKKEKILVLSMLNLIIFNATHTLCSNPDETVLQQFIPCSHCLTCLSETVTGFTLAECLTAFQEGQFTLPCGDVQVPIEELAPEVLFPSIKKISADELVIEEKIGSGGFGIVYKGKYLLSISGRLKWVKVAIKELKEIKNSNFAENFTNFFAEVESMRQLRFPTIVQLFGIQLHPLRMVLEFMPHGNLSSLLPNSFFQLTWKWRMLGCLDVARAMHFLEINSFTHRDLRTENILVYSLDENAAFRVKLADFGLARQLVSESTESGHEIWQYNPPERLADNIYDISSDVYSFAVCMWEIASRKVPFSELEEDETFFRIYGDNQREIDFFKLKEAIVNGLRPRLDLLEEQCPSQLRDLINACWNGERSLRPSFAHIVTQLESIVSTL